jgi:ATP-binding cassette subfamily F protein uup
LDKLTDQLFIMEDGGNVRIYNGNYSSYRLELEEAKQQSKKAPVAAAPVATPAPKKSKLNFKETKELETLEVEIVGVENQIKDKTSQLNAVGIEPSKLNDIINQIEDLNKKLDAKSARWMELTELKES